MKFEEVLPALREGKKVTCSIIKNSGCQYIYYKDGTIFNSEGGYWHLTDKEIVEIDDWEEIVEEPKKVKLRDLTEEQYQKWVRTNCSCRDDKCKDCIFNGVNCITNSAHCWIKNKSLFSDKFLDQEVKIEDGD